MDLQIRKDKSQNKEQNPRASVESEMLSQELKIINAYLADINHSLGDKIDEQTRLLIQAEKMSSLGILTSGIAHEITTPISYIGYNFTTLNIHFNTLRTFLQSLDKILLEIHGLGDDAVKAKVRQIHKLQASHDLSLLIQDLNEIYEESMEGFERITTIVQQLKNFSGTGYEQGKVDYNLNEGIDSTLIVAKNEYKYIAEIEKNLSPMPLTQCIASEINQVLLNIIVNAAQAIDEAKKPESGKIKITTYSEPKFICCEIEDNGPGISPEVIHKIFDPFFTTKKTGKGTGLGLNISHDIIVNKHNGDLQVESELGKWTRFTIKLPIEGDE